MWKNVRKTPEGGRYTIEARLGEGSPWVWVESILTEEHAVEFCERLEDDEDKRKEHIEDAG